MFWHNFKYSMLVTIRDKSQVFWSFIFVVALGTLFYVTFGNAYDSDEMITAIPVACYFENKDVENNFKAFIEDISFSENQNNKLLKVTYVENEEEAIKLLEDKEILGYYYSKDNELALVVNKNGIKEGILGRVVSSYHEIISIMTDVQLGAKDEKTVMSAMMNLIAGDSSNTEIKLTSGKMNPFASYFYNLLAMGCMFAGFAGVMLAIRGQGNLSTIGARKIVANGNSALANIASILANSLLLFLAEVLAMIYLMIIGVDFGNKYPAILLLLFLGTVNGLVIGYLIGSFKKGNESAKIGTCVAIDLILCFLSGLMILDMKYVMQEHAPLFNKINPPAIISDSMYALNIYDTYDVYFQNVLILVIEIVVMLIIATIVGRRKCYANL